MGCRDNGSSVLPVVKQNRDGDDDAGGLLVVAVPGGCDNM